MKKLLILIMVLVTSMYCFASVLVPRESKIAVTRHFTIVYGPDCENSAARIYENCEEIYTEITDMIGTDPDIRIPVVITNSFKINNAFFTSYPNNLIVLYDRPSVSETLAVFEDSMLSIFRHELTHALIENIRGPVPAVASKILGDYISISGALYANQFFSEGIAVYSESKSGSGRLNNSHVMEIIRQSKSDGTFPSWDVVNGTIDTYGRGKNSYIFGGAFMKYLSETYGEDILFEYFRRAGDIHLFKLSHELFISVFNTTPKKAWEAFKQSISVPETIYDCQALDISALKSEQTYESTSYSYPFFYTFASVSGDIFKVSTDGTTTSKTGNVFSLYNNLDTNADGLILASHNLQQKSDMVLLDQNGKTLLTFADGAIKGCFAHVGHTTKAVIYSADNQVGKLVFYVIENKNGKYIAAEEHAISLGFDSTVLSMDSTDSGYLVFLLKQGLKRMIVFMNLENMSMVAFDTGEEILINDISCINGSESIVFSFNSNNPSHPSFSRLGQLIFNPETNSATLHLSTKDISGGVYSPSSDGQRVFYIARFKNKDSICLSDLSFFSLEYSKTIESSAIKTGEKLNITDLFSLQSDSKKYSILKNIQRGSILPFSFNPTNEDSVALGLTWLTSDPTQSLNLMATSGYDFSEKLYYLMTEVNYSALPVALTLDSCVLVPTDKDFNPIFILQATAEKVFVLNSDNRKITLRDTVNATFADSFNLRNTFTVNYYNAKKTGLGYYDNTAHSLTLRIAMDHAEASAYYKTQPILPFKCSGKLTYNLPLTVGASIQYNYESSVTYIVLSAGATLFAYDFMDNLPGTLFFFKRMHIDATYGHGTGFVPGYSPVTTDTVSASLLFDFCPIIGRSLSEITFQVGPSMTWNLKEEKPSWTFTIRMQQ